MAPDGAFEQLPCDIPRGTRWLIAAGPALHAVTADGALHVLDLP